MAPATGPRPDWPRHHAGMMEALSRAKEQGKVRAIGVSCHNFGAFRAAASSDWVDVVLARDEIRQMTDLCDEHDPNTLITVARELTEAGVKETYRTIEAQAAGDVGVKPLQG